jgi:hypothetical protein
MFAELPKLFDRNFAIGFFLPFALATAASLYLLDYYGLSWVILPTLQKDLIVGGTIFGLFSWLGGVLLLITNRDLYRTLEGYGKFNPLRVFTRFERAYYRHLNKEIDKLDDEFHEHLDAGTEFPENLKTKRNRLMIERIERFPDRESLILPTPFGNTLRAFESYPRVMYGLESIDGWSRLLAAVPSDYRNLIDSAKAHVDFWLNLGLLSLILVIGNLSLLGIYLIMPPLWLLAITIFILLISPWRARRLAVEWGDFVKGAFDVYRFNLLDLLSIKRPETRGEEFEIWKNFSQAIVFRLPERIPELKGSDDDKKPESKRKLRAKK